MSGLGAAGGDGVVAGGQRDGSWGRGGDTKGERHGRRLRLRTEEREIRVEA